MPAVKVLARLHFHLEAQLHLDESASKLNQVVCEVCFLTAVPLKTPALCSPRWKPSVDPTSYP